MAVIHSTDSNGSGIQQERRRRLRLSLSTEQFKLLTVGAHSGKVFSVLDLSHEGMALRILDSQDFILFTVGAHVEGHINLAGRKLPVKAQVRHLAAQVVGCQFGDLDSQVKNELETFLAPASMGRAMRLMPTVSADSVWYHGASGTDLLLSGRSDSGADSQSFRKLTLYARGHYVQWEQGLGVSTGHSESADIHPPGHDGEGWGVVRFETTLMKPDSAPDVDKLSIAKALILGSKLAPELKNWCLSQLKI
jgi:hypothetical protein